MDIQIDKELQQAFGCSDHSYLIQELGRGNLPNVTSGWTLLHFYAKHNEADKLDQCITQGGSINESDSEGNSPLHLAVIYENISCVDILLKHGADTNMQEDFRRETALDFAKRKDYTEIIEMFESTGKSNQDASRHPFRNSSFCDSCEKSVLDTCECSMQGLLFTVNEQTVAMCHYAVEKERMQYNIHDLQEQVQHLTTENNKLSNNVKLQCDESKILQQRVDKVQDNYEQLYFNSIRRDGDSSTFATSVGLGYLPEDTKAKIAMIKRNTQQMREHMKPSQVICDMYSACVLTRDQHEELDDKSTQSKQVQYLLDLTIKDPKYLVSLRRALINTSQSHIAALLPEW